MYFHILQVLDVIADRNRQINFSPVESGLHLFEGHLLKMDFDAAVGALKILYNRGKIIHSAAGCESNADDAVVFVVDIFGKPNRLAVIVIDALNFFIKASWNSLLRKKE